MVTGIASNLGLGGAQSALHDRVSGESAKIRLISDGDSTGDEVEISETAIQHDRELTDEALARIERIRAEIAADTYLTPDKVDLAVDRLFRALTGS